jgi:hypothetical protein
MSDLFTNFLRWCPLFFLLLWTFYGRKIKPMLPSMKFQNGAQIQDGRQNVFIVQNLCI